MATNISKALVRRLTGKKGGGRPQAVYTHPVTDKLGPNTANLGPKGSC